MVVYLITWVTYCNCVLFYNYVLGIEDIGCWENYKSSRDCKIVKGIIVSFVQPFWNFPWVVHIFWVSVFDIYRDVWITLNSWLLWMGCVIWFEHSVIMNEMCCSLQNGWYLLLYFVHYLPLGCGIFYCVVDREVAFNGSQDTKGSQNNSCESQFNQWKLNNLY